MQYSVSRFNNGLVAVAALFVVIAGLRQAQPIVVPFLLSAFIAIICAPPVAWLERKRMPTGLAIAIVAGFMCVVGVLVVTFVSASVNDFIGQLPYYEMRLKEETGALIILGEKLGLTMPSSSVRDLLDPGLAMKMVGNLFTGLGGVLTNTFLIVLTVIFILLELSSFSGKWKQAFASGPSRDVGASSQSIREIAEGIQRYLAIKTAVSVLTGLAVALAMWIIGVDYPLLWGLVTFMLNFVPNIGSVIAAIPAVLLAWIQLGVFEASMVTAVFVVVNVVVGNVIEPRMMGRGMGLSTLVVFVSLVFWGWALGQVGMLLSVPLTMAIRIALQTVEETRWIAVLLGPETHEADGPRQ